MLRRGGFDDVPIKPQRVYHDMEKAFGRDAYYISIIGLFQIACPEFLGVYHPPTGSKPCKGPLGWTPPAALGVRDPDREIVDDFQFVVGAQFKTSTSS